MPRPTTDVFPHVPGFRIEEEIGRGTSARVFRARQENLNRLVALKVITTGGEDGNRRALRLFREAALTGALDHPGIVRAIDAGDREDFCWFAMELVDGRTLQQILDESGPLPWRRAAALALEVLDALDHAHRRGVVHRDLKPSNIILDASGRARILDLGLARRESDPRLTHEGGCVGTPRYMAPEQAVNPTKVDGRADLFSLGSILYRAISGVPPFEGETVATVLTHLLYDDPTPLAMLQPDIPAAISLVIGKVLEKDPDHRFRDAPAFAEALRQAARGIRPAALAPPRRGRRAAAFAAAGIVLAASAYFALRPPRAAPPAPVAVVRHEAAPARVQDFVPPARPDLVPLERARLAVAAARGVAPESAAGRLVAAALAEAVKPLLADLVVAAQLHKAAARRVMLSSGTGPARETMQKLRDRLRADLAAGDEAVPPELLALADGVAQEACEAFEREVRIELADIALDLEVELDRLVARGRQERWTLAQQHDAVQAVLARGGIVSIEGADRDRVLRKRDDVLKRLAEIPVEATRHGIQYASELVAERRYRSARAQIAALTAGAGDQASDPAVLVAVRPLLDVIEAGESKALADADAASDLIPRGAAPRLDAAERTRRASAIAAIVTDLAPMVPEIPELAGLVAWAERVGTVAAGAAAGRVENPLAAALAEHWDGRDDAAQARLRGLPSEALRNWLLNVVDASIEASASSYATEAERAAYPALLEARRRLHEGAAARALEVAERLRGDKRLLGTPFLREHQREIDQIASQAKQQVTRAARLRPFGDAATVRDDKTGVVRLFWDFQHGDATDGLALPAGATRDERGLSWPGTAGDLASLPEHAPALRVAFVDGTPASPVLVEVEILRSTEPLPFVGLSFAGVSFLAFGDLRRSNAFGGVPLHGLERDLVTLDRVQRAVCVFGSLKDARRVLPQAGRPVAVNRGESTTIRLRIDAARSELHGFVGEERIPLSGERRSLDEPPALDLRLPPGMVVRSLLVEVPLIPKGGG